MKFDLFDLVDVSFDPPEHRAKKVSEAIERADRELCGALGSEAMDTKRNEINAKLQFLQFICTEIFESNGTKLTQKFKELAKVRTDVEVETLNRAIATEKQAGETAITIGRIRRMMKPFGIKLASSTIEKTYTEAGFTIRKTQRPTPAFPRYAEHIPDALAKVRNFADHHKFYPSPRFYPKQLGSTQDLDVPTQIARTVAEVFSGKVDESQSLDSKQELDNTLVTDLYAFIAYLEGEPENAALYRNMCTDELANILDRHAIALAKRAQTYRDPLGQVLENVVTLAKFHVFDSDLNRIKYDKHLLFKSETISELVKNLQAAKKVGLHLDDPKYAEPAIRQIVDVFGNRAGAVAMYIYITGIDEYELDTSDMEEFT